jgi:dGTPase
LTGSISMKEFSVNDILSDYRKVAETKEESLLHPKASFSKNHNRFHAEITDHRLPYKRDVDRIVHSKAYTRYSDKTQVVYLVDNDHITHRALHVQLVSSFARGMAEILHLNLDLVEAIALGHDVGHSPFGHEGENYLSALSVEYGNGPFSHPLQSCRLFSIIEPINLGLAVYDGFLCHDGGMCGTMCAPQFGKTWDDHHKELTNKKIAPEKNIWPGTLEGCLVKLCDTMSYLGRDIEDAINLGILSRDHVPKTILGNSNREILSVLARDIIQMSYGKDYIALSDDVYEAMRQLRVFNFKNIYTHPKLKVESKKIQRSYRILFQTLLEELEVKKQASYIWKNFVHNKSEKYISETSPVQMVVDYISGMTDTFFIRTLETLVVPKRIEI